MNAGGRTGLALAVLLVVPVLAACAATPVAPAMETPAAPESDGSPPAPEDDAPAVDVCELVSGIDTATLVNAEMDAGTSQGDTCVIEPVDASSTGSMRVTWLATGGAARYAQQRELLGVSSEVPGFGDAAFLTGTWLLGMRGDEFLSVQVVPDIFADGERLTDARLIAAAETVAFNAGWFPAG